jgi:hypothetical protein
MAGMSAPANCRLVGRWRIVEADIWDQAYLDLGALSPARGLYRRGDVFRARQSRRFASARDHKPRRSG